MFVPAREMFSTSFRCMLMLYALKASVTSQGRNEQGDKTNKKCFKITEFLAKRLQK